MTTKLTLGFGGPAGKRKGYFVLLNGKFVLTIWFFDKRR